MLVVVPWVEKNSCSENAIADFYGKQTEVKRMVDVDEWRKKGSGQEKKEMEEGTKA